MRLSLLALCAAMLMLLGGCAAADEGFEPGAAAVPEADIIQESGDKAMKIRISAGGESFTATLNATQAAGELAQRLPMTLNMSELNGNEKYYYMDAPLARNASRVGRINAGDIMLFGDDCLVIFYKSFSTGYSYTPLGRIDDAANLAEALGSGSVSVTIEALG